MDNGRFTPLLLIILQNYNILLLRKLLMPGLPCPDVGGVTAEFCVAGQLWVASNILGIIRN